MNRKEILIVITLIFCLAFALQAVAAADADGNGTDSELLSTDDVSAYSLPDSDQSLRSGDAGSFSDLHDDIINNNVGGKVNLTRNYTWSSADSSNPDISAGVPISGEVTINGNGKVTLDAQSQNRIFKLETGSKVTLIGITFINGKASAKGGAIYTDSGALTIINCSFIDNAVVNTQTDDGGGAVYAGINGLKVYNSNFNNNKVLTKGPGNTNFGGDAGAIFTIDDLYVEGCNFTDNVGMHRAGAIRMNNRGVINNSNIYNSHSLDYGGAITTSENSEFYNTNFYNNYVVNRALNYGGGAINPRSDKYIKMIKNCTFVNNTGDYGGAVKTTGGATIQDSRFIDNHGLSYGGAVYLGGSTITNCNFTGNDAPIGGAVYQAKGTITFTGSNFINNTATSTDGGAIWSGTNKLILTGCSFINNNADGQGGAVLCGIAEVTNSVFKDNTAVKEGGALNVGAASTFSNSNFTNNKVTGSNINGGAVYADSYTVTVTNSRFINNTATGLGGAIYAGKTTVTGSLFENNKVTGDSKDGGALYIGGDDSKVSGSDFIKNSATNYGGAIYWNGGTGSLSGTRFTGDKSKKGGSVYWFGTGGTVLNTNFTGSSADEGGAIYWEGSTGSVSHSVFKENNATTAAALYIAGSDASYFGVSYSDFISNKATGDAGAIYSGHTSMISSRTALIFDSNFINNTAGNNGGAIVIGSDIQDITDCNFTGNNATRYGGAVYVGSVYGINIDGSTFKESYAYNGGAIYDVGTPGASLKLRDDDFIDNIASHNGGALYYVVDNAPGSTSIAYVDSNNFYGNGHIDPANNRTTSNLIGQNVYRDIIDNCLFESNEDYFLNVSAKGSNETTSATVYLYNFNDRDIDSLNVTIIITVGDNVINSTIINRTTYNVIGHYNPITGTYSVIFYNLTTNQTYNVTIGFSDANYLYKENHTNFTVTGQQTIGDFEILQGLIDGAIRDNKPLYLDRDFNYFINLDHGCVNITAPITIYGGGSAINAKNYCRIFNITAPNVIIYDLILNNGNATGLHGDGNDHGGAIFWAGANGELHNTNLNNNYAEVGGGIYFNVTASNCKIRGCTFTSNKANGNGGAIDCNASRMNLTNTVFTSNYGYYGAALCREANATNGFGFNNRFIGNHAYRSGAALGWMNAVNITITNYTFIDNTADRSGGAIYISNGSGRCNIYDSYFEGNNVTDNDNSRAGAIFIGGPESYITNSIFINNNAYYGGAIFIGRGTGNTTVTNSIFTSNHANSAFGTGGAVSLDSSSIMLNNSRFNYNTAHDGGAIFMGGVGHMNNIYISAFTGNRATGGYGGALDWNASSGNIYDSNFTSNYADYGGAIYMGGRSDNSTIARVQFIRNNATYNGGAIDWNTTNGYLINTTFKYNEAEYGAALCRESEAKGGHGENNWFEGNYARLEGAALAWMGSANITITNYTFIDNTAIIGGAAIYVNPDAHNCSVIDCYFRGNNITNDTGGHGGAIHCQATNMTVKNTDFIDNHAYYGGALFMGGDSGNTNISDSRFYYNGATESGGAITILSSSVEVDDSYFFYNTALNGGAMVIGNNGEYNHVNSSTFVGNRADGGRGGAIEWLSAAGHLIDSNFTKNYADTGGAIYLNGNSRNTEIINITFDGNEAVHNGGAIDWAAENGGLFNNTFINNKAEYGAALCREVDAKRGHGDNNTFKYNHAYKEGAALAWMGSIGIKITNYTFIDNTADFGGGAIYAAEESHNCSIIDCYFRGNNVTNATGGHGGAIDSNADNATITNTIFIDNHAFVAGAIYLGGDSGNSNITNSTFSYNGAVRNGGAIYLSSSSILIDISNFTYNTADNGGAIYVNGTGITNNIYSTIFENNHADNGNGGAIDWVASNGHLMYCNFTSNYAKNGGGIFMTGSSDDTWISHAIFLDNHATEHGGAIDCNAKSMNLTHTNFTSNYANYGAALCRESNATGGFGVNNTFDKNHAYISGAALAWMDVGNIKINNYTFTNNTADYTGAAIYVSVNSPNCEVHNSTFEDNFISNAIDGRGGAIEWLGDNGKVVNTTFTRCISLDAGGIFVGAESNNMKIFNSTFTLCRSLSNGGAIIILSDNVTIAQSNFISSVSGEDGGAIAGFNSSNANISDCLFKYSTSAGYTGPDGVTYGEGGAIYWTDSTNLRISNIIFKSNVAHLSGGSISADNCSDSIVYNITTFNDTSVTHGGSLSWINSRNVTIENGFFNDSGTNYNGGTIYLNNVDDIVVKNIEINSTWASWEYGGGIFVGGNVTIDNVMFNDTHSYQDKGTAIYFEYGNSTVVNSTFTYSKNSIYICEDAEVHLIENNLTAKDPNKATTPYLKDNSTETISVTSYTVWNEGTLYLYKNNFDYVIFNNGTIETSTNTWILDNKTWNLTWMDYWSFWANITDDNNNTIISVSSLDTYNNVYPNRYNMSYNKIDLQLSLQGRFVIYGEDDGLKDNTIYPGTVYVKMPTTLTITNTTDLYAQEDISFIVKLTLPADSNYTIDWSKFKVKLNDVLVSEHDKKIYYDNYTVGDKWKTAYVNFTVHHLPVGNYRVTAEYETDFYHNAAYNETAFSMFSHDMWIAVHADNILYGQTLVINVTSNATNTVNGRIRISINGKIMSDELKLDENGSYVYYLPNNDPRYSAYLEPGIDQVVSVSFTNGTYYTPQSNSSFFNVSQLDCPMNVTPINIKFGENEIINVTVNENATGYVAIRIGNNIHVVILDHGEGQFNITGLPVGNYTDILVMYQGDPHYKSNMTYINFTVSQATNYVMDLKVDNITYGQNATIRVKVPTTASGNVTVYIDGVYNGTVNITEGSAELKVPGLTGGEHNVTATYNGDSSYASRDFNKTTFNVYENSDWKMTITSDERPYGENTTVTIRIAPYHLYGNNVTLVIDNVHHVVNFTGGVATLTINNLSVGSYRSFAIYDGDGSYSRKEQIFYLTIAQTKPTVTLTRVNDDVIATVSGNTTGNVTFNINGRAYVIPLEGRTATLSNNLTVGNNFIVAVYNGDKNYTEAFAMKNYIVEQFTTSINATPVNITYGNDEVFNVTVNKTASGYIVVIIGNHEYLKPIINGTAQFNITGLTTGLYKDIRVVYSGDTNFTRSETNMTFKVDPATNYVMDLKVDNITYGQNATIRVKVPTDASGNVTIYVDGVYSGTVNITEGSAELNVPNVAGGDHNVTATYNGDPLYGHRDFNETSFTVKQNTDWKMNITSVERPYGEDTIITINTLPYHLSGNNVTLVIDGVPYVRNITNGIATLTINNLTPGSYKSFAIYEGDGNYSRKNQTFFVKIAQAKPSISIAVADVAYVGDTVQVTVTLPSEIRNENVTIEINGKKFTNTTDSNGRAILYIPSVTYGNKTVTATYNGNNKFTGNSTTANFTVLKRDSTLNVTATATTVLNDVLINVTIPANATGYVVVNVNGTNYTINTTSGNGSVAIKVLGNGTYWIHVTYIGDDQYLESTNNTVTFNVIKSNINMTVNVTDIDYSQAANVTVTVPEGVSGNITLTIKETGDTITLPIFEGKVEWIVPNLDVGNYTVLVTYNGDSYYNINSTNKTFKVKSISPEIEILPVEIDAINNATITVNVPGASDGSKVNITVNGTTYNATVKDGVANVTIDVLPVGEYNITATFLGDDNYNVTSTTLVNGLNVTKVPDYLINLTALNITVGADGNITVYVPAGADGNVTIWIDDTPYSNVTDNGIATFIIPNIPVGDHTINATLVNDTRYGEKTAYGTFNVAQRTTPINVTVRDIVYVGDDVTVVVTVPAGATGNITIEINGKNQTAEIDDYGNATFTIRNVTYGNKTIAIDYIGDAKYVANHTTAQFEVLKLNSYVFINVDDINVDQLAHIEITAPDSINGNVIVTIDEIEYNVNITNGNGLLEIGLGNGTHNITAVYLENSKYLSSTNKSNITVSKLNTTLGIVVDDINYTQIANITVTVPEGVSGNITLTIKETGDTITLPIFNNKVEWSVPDRAVGNYTVLVTYNGDSYYNINSTNKTFKVKPISPVIEILPVEIDAINNATITVNVPGASDGSKVNITVNGTTYNATVKDGVANVTIDVLPVGEYNITATFLGDDNYNITSATLENGLNVTKADDYLINLTALNIIVGADGNVTVYVPVGADGNVTIWIDNTPYSNITDNGIATFIIPNIPVGEHTVNATLVNDTRYGEKTAYGSFTVSQADTPMAINVTDVAYVGDDVTVVVSVPAGAKGNITIEIDGKNQSAKIDDYGNATFTIRNVTYGNKTIAIDYIGDANFTRNFTTAEFEVLKLDSFVFINVDDINVDQRAHIEITAPDSINGNVIVTIDEIEYNVNITNGNGLLEIVLGNGTHNITAVYLENSKYLSSTNKSNITVSKLNTTLGIVAEDINYPESANITVTVLEGVSGKITLAIEGTDKITTLTICDGKVNWIVPGLAVGNYTVHVTYNGDNNYNVNSSDKKFEVKPSAPVIEISPVTTDAVTNATITVKVGGVADGKKFNITVNGTTYNTTVQNGEATAIINVLPVGKYDIIATYPGDENFGETTEVLPDGLTVTKASDYLINLTTKDIVLGSDGNITVYVPEGADGNVTICIDNTPYSNITDNGIATFIIPNIPVGDHTVNATLVNDTRYGEKTAYGSFRVYRSETPMAINVTEVAHVGDDVTVVVSVPAGAKGNITIEIDGKNQSAEIDDYGNATFTIRNVTYGNKTIAIDYAGDANFTRNFTTARFEVLKLDSFVTIKVTDINATQTAHIDITAPDDIKGHVIVTIEGIEYNVNITNGHGFLDVPGLGNGTHNITAVYLENSKYLSSTNKSNVTVSKLNATLGVVADDINYTQIANITVTVPEGVSGNITLTIKETGDTITLPIFEGKVEWNVPDLEVGNYTVIATYNGDVNYNINSTNRTFKVKPVEPAIEISQATTDAIHNATITVKVPGASDGSKVNITVNGTTYNATVKDGVANVTIDVLPVGEYNITATFLGDKNYNATSTTLPDGLTVTKSPDYLINLTAKDIVVGSDGNITVYVPEGADGNVTIWIDGTPYSNITDNGIATFIIPNIPIGDHTVNATLVNDTRYGEKTAYGSFTVSQADTPMAINVTNVAHVGDDVTVVVTVPAGVKGNITIEIDGKNQSAEIDEFGNATFTINKVTYGNKTITATYAGNDNFTRNFTTAKFEVLKHESYVKVNVSEITADQPALINVTVPDDAKGEVLLDIDGKHYYANITGGVARFTITDLKADNNNITVTYGGDDKYYGNSNTSNITVSKLQPVFTVNGRNITFGSDEIITIETGSNITGEVTVRINNDNYTAFIKEGKGNLTVSKLAANDYNVTVYFNGNDKFLNATANNTFTVNQTAASLGVLVENITYGEIETVYVFVNATGTVTFKLNGAATGETRDIVDGKVIYPIEGLAAGNYTIEVIYDGNNNVTSSSDKYNFTVEKADPKVTVDVQNIVYGGVEYIIVKVNADGNVTIKVGDKYEETIKLNHTTLVLRASRWAVVPYDGEATLEIHNLDAGSYPVEVTYNGNDNYNTAVVNTDFEVYKANTTVEAKVKDALDVGETQVINITVNNNNATGNVTIVIDGKNYTENVSGGLANFTTPVLPRGNYTVVVIYEGDDNLNGNWTYGTFTVGSPLEESPMDITADPIKVGEVAEITVELPDKATGNVTIEIDGKIYEPYEFKDGIAKFKIENLTAGNKTFVAKYSGDENYTSNITSGNFTVDKRKSNVSAVISPTDVGSPASVTVTVPYNATGYVILEIGNETFAIEVHNGTGTGTISGLTNGTHNINVTYLGDDTYEPSYNTTDVTVSKLSSDISIKVENITVGDEAIINITAAPGVYGNVTVKIGNITTTAYISNGQGIAIIPNLPVGNHTVNATFVESDRYATSNDTAKLEVSQISVLPEDIKVVDQGNGTVVVVVPKDATGNITVEIEDEKYNATIENGTAIINMDNTTPGTHNAKVIYSGDKNHTGTVKNAEVTAPKFSTPISVDASPIEVGDKAIITVEIPENATGKITIEIDGRTCEPFEFSDGIAKFEIENLNDGNKTFAVIYEGDDNYVYNSTTANITVSKRPSEVSATITDEGNGNVFIEVTATDGLTGQVLVDIEGVGYYVNVTNGRGTAHIPSIPNGKYNATVKFTGNDKYQPSSNRTSFNVTSSDTEMEVYDLGNGTVVVYVAGDASGNVTVKVGDENYTAIVKDGVAKVDLDRTPPGSYEIEVIYTDEAQNNHTKKAVANIPKDDTKLSIDVSNIKVGDVETVTVNVPKGASGDVTIEIDGKKYTSPINGGKAVFKVSGLSEGRKTVAVTYVGDEKYEGKSSTAQFTVSKRSSTINAKSTNIRTGANEVIVVNVPKDATGRVLVDINGVGYYGTVVNGKAKIIVPELFAGTYKATVTYEGDNKYLPSKTTTTFKVTKSSSNILATGDEVEEGQDATVVVNVPKDATGTVTIRVDGKEYTTEVKNGKAIFVISGLGEGDHKIDASYSGNKYYEANDTITDVEVYYSKHPQPEPEHNEAGSHESEGLSNLQSNPTGNPILLLLLVILSIGSIRLGKFRK